MNTTSTSLAINKTYLSHFGFEQKSQVKSVYQNGHDEF